MKKIELPYVSRVRTWNEGQVRSHARHRQRTGQLQYSLAGVQTFSIHLDDDIVFGADRHVSCSSQRSILLIVDRHEEFLGQHGGTNDRALYRSNRDVQELMTAGPGGVLRVGRFACGGLRSRSRVQREEKLQNRMQKEGIRM